MNKLKEMREKAGLTQHQLADRAHVEQSTIALLEVGKRKARFATIRKLAMALGISSMELTQIEDTEVSARAKRAVPAIKITKAKHRHDKALRWWLFFDPYVAERHGDPSGIEFTDKFSLAYNVSNLGPDVGYMTYYGTREEVESRERKFATEWANGRVDYHRRFRDKGIILDGSHIRCLVDEAVEATDRGQRKQKQQRKAQTTGKLGPASCSECGRPALEGTFLCEEHAKLL